ncbi:MAG TPA: carbohydrate ABC transporter permease [bacterium]|nr:carbohydrate ABC transporter permease [bacterium]
MASARARRTLADGAAFCAVAAFVVVALFPFYWMLRTAFTPRTTAYSLHPSVWPGAITAENFARVMTSPTIPFGLYFKNSLIVSVATTVLVLVAGSWGAYALARMDFRGKNAFGIALLVIQMFPPVVLIIPLFIVMARLHLVDTYFGLVLALVTLNLPFVTWLLRGYFLSLPKELEDAARIDGCGRFGVLFRIALPLAAPGVAAVATLSMVNSWNDFLYAFVLINNDARKVLATGLAAYGQSNNDYTALFAMATLTTVPIVALFMLFQRYLVGGLAAGSVKG